MMQGHRANRVDFPIEAAMPSRQADALKKAGVTRHTMLPVPDGLGRSGERF
tara:strand:- start:6831 stop:6983 length:153 start_codon:yes stop_codon:yes gene_type:complete